MEENMIITKKTILISMTLLLANTAVLAVTAPENTQSIDSIQKYVATFTAAEKDLRPQVLELALKAYENAKTEGIAIKKPILTVVDYTLPSTAKRMWVLDLATSKVLFNTLVAHGKNSGDLYSTKFSNNDGSKESSIGTFVTEGTYDGKHGTSLKISGLDKGFNDKAKPRLVVMHSANYVSEEFVKVHGMIGRSWGCLALNPEVAPKIINTVKDGSVIFSYYPDQKLLASSKVLNYRV
jgi:hypothetical protein